MEEKHEQAEKFVQFFRDTSVKPEEINPVLESNNSATLINLIRCLKYLLDQIFLWMMLEKLIVLKVLFRIII